MTTYNPGLPYDFPIAEGGRLDQIGENVGMFRTMTDVPETDACFRERIMLAAGMEIMDYSFFTRKEVPVIAQEYEWDLL